MEPCGARTMMGSAWALGCEAQPRRAIRGKQRRLWEKRFFMRFHHEAMLTSCHGMESWPDEL
jgi:hypothetical protein